MANEKLSAALRERAASEQQIYRDRLYAMSAKEALEHAFEYTTRENILLALESPELEDIQIRALLSSYSPLKDIFTHYDNHDFSLMEGIRKSIAELADDTLTTWRELPVYKYPGAYAREHEELELYASPSSPSSAVYSPGPDSRGSTAPPPPDPGSCSTEYGCREPPLG